LVTCIRLPVEEELGDGSFPKGWASWLTTMQIAGEDMAPLLFDRVVFIVVSCCVAREKNVTLVLKLLPPVF
jgi:hypothetical protein